MNPNRDKGIRAERTVVAYLREHGHPHARRALAGPAADVGDVEGTRAVWEIRDRARFALPSWLADLDRKAQRAGTALRFLVIKPARMGSTRIGAWPVVLRPGVWAALARSMPRGCAAVSDMDARAGLNLAAITELMERERVERLAFTAAARVLLRSGLVVMVTTLGHAASLLPPSTTVTEDSTHVEGKRV